MIQIVDGGRWFKSLVSNGEVDARNVPFRMIVCLKDSLLERERDISLRRRRCWSIRVEAAFRTASIRSQDNS